MLKVPISCFFAVDGLYYEVVPYLFLFCKYSSFCNNCVQPLFKGCLLFFNFFLLSAMLNVLINGVKSSKYGDQSIFLFLLIQVSESRY